MILDKEIELVADFMGMRKEGDDFWVDKNTGAGLIMGAYRPHEDWNEMMSVVAKISTIKYPEYWKNGKPEDANDWDDAAYLRTFGMRDEHGNYMVRFNASPLFRHETLIGALWMAVVDMIEWLHEINSKSNSNG